MMTSDRNKIVLTILLVFASPEILLSVARQWGNYPKSLNSIYLMKHSWITALCDSMGKSKYLDSLEDSVCLWSYMIRLGVALEPVCLIIETCVLGAVGILLVINSYRCTKRYETKVSQSILLTAYTFCMPIVMMCYYYMVLH